LAVGDVVVYAGHGTGRITARERRTGASAEQEVVVLELDQGLVVTLPLTHARQRIRPVARETDLLRLQQTLRQQSDGHQEGWQKRFKQSQAKLASGELLGLAEIVRDGSRKESQATASSRLSPSERQLYLRARQLLVLEISAARRLDPAQAEAWIDVQTTGA
jgi:RNA polymerase-interacting CarD/CdnL/TRCF family regulator